MKNKKYYKIIKIVEAKNIKEAIKKEHKAEILEIFVPDKLPFFFEE